MIITITCNPAIDKTIYEDKVVFDAGGKGINVSKIIKNLGADSIATGFIGKKNKNIIIDELDKLNIKHHFIEIDGDVRTNTKRIINNDLFEENEKGPSISEDNKNQLIDYLKQYSNDIVVLSGSCTSDIYYDLVKTLKDNNNYVILDCANELLVSGIKAKPDVIKPNKSEIIKFFNCEYNESEIIEKIKKLGLDFVCLSLGDSGSIFIYKNKVYKVKPEEVDYRSALGAGDAMVAAIAYSKLNNFDIMETIKLAVACASATCETEGSKAPNKQSVILKKEKVEVLSYERFSRLG